MPCIHLEIIYQGSHCPASHYMDKAVEEVLPLYGEHIRYTKVEYKKVKVHSNASWNSPSPFSGKAPCAKAANLLPFLRYSSTEN